MKKLFIIFTTIFALSFFALAQMNVYIYKKDGTKDTYVASKVDSIGFVNTTTGTENGHEWVDLDLPSGTKWATCNVGANSPEEFGDYFAWGEITTKSSYTSYNYNYSSNPITLPLERDVAYVKWGSSWRMPTIDEILELVSASNITWTSTTKNGIKGCEVTSKTNGNSIFLPTAGYRNDSDLNDAGSEGYYRSSSLYTNNSRCVWFMGFHSNCTRRTSFGYVRYLGYTVRPVLREVVTYEVSFDSNGGEGTMGSITIESTEQLSVPSNTFTREGYEFTGWNTQADGGGTSYVVGAEVTLTSDIILYAQWKKTNSTIGIANGHEWVDLGLPSGTKWATTNVGATTPEEYGDYFAWGETEPKSDYSWSTYKWCNGSSTTMTKYCESSSYGTVDNKTILELSDDAANVKWGGKWRMPTVEEIEELLNTDFVLVLGIGRIMELKV